MKGRFRGTADVAMQSPLSPTAVIELLARMARSCLQRSLPPEHRVAASGRERNAASGRSIVRRCGVVDQPPACCSFRVCEAFKSSARSGDDCRGQTRPYVFRFRSCVRFRRLRQLARAVASTARTYGTKLPHVGFLVAIARIDESVEDDAQVVRKHRPS